MANDGGGRDLYDRLMAASGEALAAGHYGAAYHALMAAMHCAEEADDVPRLLDVARVAEEQREVVDALEPAHRLSSRIAQGRGRESIFASAARQAQTQAKIVEQAHRPAWRSPT
jgi:hypothetical protein